VKYLTVTIHATVVSLAKIALPARLGVAVDGDDDSALAHASSRLTWNAHHSHNHAGLFLLQPLKIDLPAVSICHGTNPQKECHDATLIFMLHSSSLALAAATIL
jgi:hypothetical protein